MLGFSGENYGPVEFEMLQQWSSNDQAAAAQPKNWLNLATVITIGFVFSIVFLAR